MTEDNGWDTPEAKGEQWRADMHALAEELLKAGRAWEADDIFRGIIADARLEAKSCA